MTSPTPTSAPGPLSWRERALARFPAGSNGEFGIPPEQVPVLERGAGARVWDTEGREFLDLTMAWGSALVGHAHPKVVEAATRAAVDGCNFASINRRAVELAERIAALSPCAERLRFVASGTEATLLCLRIARTATDRPDVLKFEGAYHGQHGVGVASMISGQRSNLPWPDLTGTGAPWVEHEVRVAPFNDLATTTRYVNELRSPRIDYVWSASTTGGNPVSCAAALAALDVFAEPGVYPHLHALGRRLRQAMTTALQTTNTVAQVLGDGPLAQIAFSATPVTDQQSWLASDRRRGRAVMLELLQRGVFLNPMGTKLYLSLAHTDADVDAFAGHLAAALAATRP